MNDLFQYQRFVSLLFWNNSETEIRLSWLVLIFAIGFVPLVSYGQVKTSVTEPFETSQIAAAEQGVIQEIRIREGQEIDAGAALANLNLGVLPETRKLAELKANSLARIQAAKAELKLRQIQKDNMEELSESGHANPFEVEQVLAKFEQAAADYQGALEAQSESLAELAKIDAEIEARTIRSPIRGIVTEIHKRHGEFASANDPVFATIVQLEQLRVRFHLKSETTISLRAGQQVQVFIGEKQIPQTAMIEFVSPVVEPKTGLARVNVLIDNRARKIRSGIVCRWEQASVESAQTPRSSMKR